MSLLTFNKFFLGESAVSVSIELSECFLEFFLVILRDDLGDDECEDCLLEFRACLER